MSTSSGFLWVCSMLQSEGLGVSMAQCDYAWPQLPAYGFSGPPVGCCGYVWLIIEILSSRVFSMYMTTYHLSLGLKSVQ